MIRKLNKILNFFGLNPKKLFVNLKSIKWYCQDYLKIKKQLKDSSEFKMGDIFPVLYDKDDHSGIVSGHYFHQDLYMAQKLFSANPLKHVDIGSRTDGFVAHIASFREIEVFDIRDLKSTIKNIKFKQADFTIVDKDLKNYTDSISSLHAIEHFGLGRYGDQIDINGHLKGLNVIYETLKDGGIFYFSTPIGPQRINFNAHRVFSLKYLLSILSPKYELITFSYVNDQGDLIINPELTEDNINSSFNCNYGCGMFELRKL